MVALGNWRVLDCKKKQTAAVSDRDSGLRTRVNKEKTVADLMAKQLPGRKTMEWRERVEVGDRRAQG